MWGRVVEIMTAVWLGMSPYIFRSQGNDLIIRVDSLVSLTIIVLSGLSYWRPTRHAHLGILVVAIALTVWGRIAELPPPPVHQNHIFVGLFLLMIAIIPNHALRPPRVWREVAD